jgi:predicted nucleotide-binding protein/DNA-binding MarR family transcriptional regulator
MTGVPMEFNELEIHVQKILRGLVEFYLEHGYKDESYNDPERGGIYEHKLANRLGYQLTSGDFPPPEFMAAAQILEAKGFVKRMKRKDEFPILGIWPTPSGVLEYQKIVKKPKSEDAMNSVDNTRVFVVHGRNEELRKSLFDFLRSIGLKPIEWSQAIRMTGETAPFIGDILDAAFQQAQAVVVLLNGDDEARLRLKYHSDKMPEYEKNLTPQARPNVIFEAGLALGRFPRRTIIVEIGDLRPFSDIAGRHTIRLSNSTKSRQDLAQRLSIAGCAIDLSGTDWHQSGNFEATHLTNISLLKSASTKNNSLVENNMHETKIKILEYLSNSKSRYRTFPDLLKDLQISTPVAIHFLNEMIIDGLVIKDTSDYGELTYITITDSGVRTLIEIGKI